MKILYSTLAAVVLAACQSPNRQPASGTSEASATLGVTTAVPSNAQARAMGLAFQVRQQGRIVESVASKSPAFEAGVRSGDVLLQLGNVTLYSQDDIDDFIAIHKPGAKVRATLVRNETNEREEILITLGQGGARPSGALRWQFASLAQLPFALERARAEKKKVLVGLSGAET